MLKSIDNSARCASVLLNRCYPCLSIDDVIRDEQHPVAYNNGCSEGLGCHNIIVKDFGCTMSTDNQPIQPDPDYPWAP